MKPHFRKVLRLTNDEDPPPLLQPPAVSAAAPPSATIRNPLRPPLTSAPFDSSVGLTVLVLFSALFFMGFFSLYIRRFAEGPESAAASRRRRRLHRDQTGPTPPYAPRERPSCTVPRKGLDPAVIRSLPAFAYGGEGARYQADCAVCLSDFEEEEVVKAIPWCSHVFHAECIDRWLCAHVSCPVCRDERLMEASRGAQAGRVEGSSAGGRAAVRNASEPEARSTSSTVTRVDACLEIRDGGDGGSSLRRSRSWSRLGDERSLQRTLSF